MPSVFKPFSTIEKFPSLSYTASVTWTFKPDDNSSKQENATIMNTDTKILNKILASLSDSIKNNKNHPSKVLSPRNSSTV